MKTRCLNCMKEYSDEYDICPHCGFVRGTPPKESYHLHPGVVLHDRYIVGTVVSFGGFGVVYRAWDTKLELMVAIKEYFPTAVVTRTPGEKYVIFFSGGNRKEIFRNGLECFLEEARNTAKFGNHPNITNVFTYFEENNTAYMVMEYLPGITLKEFLKQNGGKIDIDTTINILMSIINALKEVHKDGMLHRDISPDNIFICTNNTVKLIDFGAGKFADENEALTREVVVKPGYAPPEQYDTKSVQAAWTDIYALGATMYRAITGIVPDESTNRKEKDTLIPPKQVDDSIPDYIDSALMRAMAVTPEFRFKSAQEFEDAILNKKVFRTEAQQRKFLLRRRLIGVAAAAIIIGIVGLHNYLEYDRKQKAAQLEDCTITVWMPEGENKEATKKEYQGMVEEFTQQYKKVKVEVSYVPEAEYQDKLTEAARSGKLPTVFDGDYMTEEIAAASADISDIVTLLDNKDYYFLKAYKDYYPDGKQIPTGFSIPIIYGDRELMKTGTVGKSNDKKSFLSQKTAVYISGKNEYREIEEVIQGNHFAVMPVSSKDINAYFTDTWSVGANGSEAQINAGKRLIYYFLGQRAEDVVFIQNDGENLPLNKQILKSYTESVNSLLEFLPDEADDAHIDKETGEDPKEYYSRLYKEEISNDKDAINELLEWLEEGE